MTGPAAPQVGVLLYPRVELLDFAGPAEVFDVAGESKAFDVVTVAETTDPLLSQGFLTVTPEKSIDDDFSPDILVVPGGNSEWLVEASHVLDWIDGLFPAVEQVLTVCTGAFALAVRGHLDGLTATTHHLALDRLRRHAPRTRVVEDRRVVDNGKVITTAGVAAGIDGALHLVARRLGEAEARRTARYIELDWDGPASA